MDAINETETGIPVDQDAMDEAKVRQAVTIVRTKGEGDDLKVQWRIVGEALAIGRRWAMRMSSSNNPIGRRYREKLEIWYSREEHAVLRDGMDTATRTALLWLYDDPANSAALDEMLGGMTPAERIRMASPITAKQKVAAFLDARRTAGQPHEPPEPAKPAPDTKAALEAELAEAKATIAALQKRDGGSVDFCADTMEAILAVAADALATRKRSAMWTIGLARAMAKLAGGSLAESAGDAKPKAKERGPKWGRK